MKAFFLIFSIAFSFAAKGQDWALFPVNQKNYYAIQNDTGYVVRTFCADSVRVDNGSSTVFSNSYMPRFSYSDISRETLLRRCSGGLANEVRPDLVETRADSVFVNFYAFNDDSTWAVDEAGSFLFLPRAHSGTTWKYWKPKNLEISCVGETVEDILGTQDSVKKYQAKAKNGQLCEFVLSKHHGLVQFYPFQRLTYAESLSPVKLFGFEKDGQKAGYRRPGFSDYFHFQPGDILMWRFILNTSLAGYSIDEYRKDSILEVNDYETEYSYKYRRTTWNKNNFSGPDTLSEIFPKRMWNDLIDSPTEWISIFELDDTSSRLYCTRTLYVEIGKDTVSEYRFNNTGVMIERSEQTTIWSEESAEGYVLSTKTGIKSHYFGMFDLSQKSVLVGSRLGGVVDGNLDFPTSAKTIVRDLPLVFPNPSHGVIQIRAATEIRLFEVFNLNGTKLRSGKVDSGSIDLSSLPKGIYLLRLTDKSGKTFQQKVVLN